MTAGVLGANGWVLHAGSIQDSGVCGREGVLIVYAFIFNTAAD